MGFELGVLTADCRPLTADRTPQVPVVPARQRRSFHADGFHRGDFAQGSQVLFEAEDGLFVIAFAIGEVVVVVADLMAQGGDLPDDLLVKMSGQEAKVVGTANTQLMLNLCESQRIAIARLHVVAEDDGTRGRLFQEFGVGLEGVGLCDQRFEERAVCF